MKGQRFATPNAPTDSQHRTEIEAPDSQHRTRRQRQGVEYSNNCRRSSSCNWTTISTSTSRRTRNGSIDWRCCRASLGTAATRSGVTGAAPIMQSTRRAYRNDFESRRGAFWILPGKLRRRSLSGVRSVTVTPSYYRSSRRMPSSGSWNTLRAKRMRL